MQRPSRRRAEGCGPARGSGGRGCRPHEAPPTRVPRPPARSRTRSAFGCPHASEDAAAGPRTAAVGRTSRPARSGGPAKSRDHRRGDGAGHGRGATRRRRRPADRTPRPPPSRRRRRPVRRTPSARCARRDEHDVLRPARAAEPRVAPTSAAPTPAVTAPVPGRGRSAHATCRTTQPEAAGRRHVARVDAPDGLGRDVGAAAGSRRTRSRPGWTSLARASRPSRSAAGSASAKPRACASLTASSRLTPASAISAEHEVAGAVEHADDARHAIACEAVLQAADHRHRARRRPPRTAAGCRRPAPARSARDRARPSPACSPSPPPARPRSAPAIHVRAGSMPPMSSTITSARLREQRRRCRRSSTPRAAPTARRGAPRRAAACTPPRGAGRDGAPRTGSCATERPTVPKPAIATFNGRGRRSCANLLRRSPRVLAAATTPRPDAGSPVAARRAALEQPRVKRLDRRREVGLGPRRTPGGMAPACARAGAPGRASNAAQHPPPACRGRPRTRRRPLPPARGRGGARRRRHGVAAAPPTRSPGRPVVDHDRHAGIRYGRQVHAAPGARARA